MNTSAPCVLASHSPRTARRRRIIPKSLLGAGPRRGAVLVRLELLAQLARLDLLELVEAALAAPARAGRPATAACPAWVIRSCSESAPSNVERSPSAVVWMLDVMESTMSAASSPASVSGAPSSSTSSRNDSVASRPSSSAPVDRVRVEVGRALELADDVLERRPPVGCGRAEVVRPGLARGLVLAAAPGGQHDHGDGTDQHRSDHIELPPPVIIRADGAGRRLASLRHARSSGSSTVPASGSRARSTGRSSSWPCSRPAPTAARSTRGSSTCSWSRPCVVLWAAHVYAHAIAESLTSGKRLSRRAVTGRCRSRELDRPRRGRTRGRTAARRPGARTATRAPSRSRSGSAWSRWASRECATRAWLV